MYRCIVIHKWQYIDTSKLCIVTSLIHIINMGPAVKPEMVCDISIPIKLMLLIFPAYVNFVNKSKVYTNQSLLLSWLSLNFWTYAKH